MGTTPQIRIVGEEELHLDVLPKKTVAALRYMASEVEWVSSDGWYLAGGTALALQVGHRESVDLDFFTNLRHIETDQIEQDLLRRENWVTTLSASDTLYGKIKGAKASFIAYPFFLVNGPLLQLGNIRIVPPEDIAVMKIVAISQRGKRRDFIDLYWYCHHRESLLDLLKRTPDQYESQAKNINHILKSLRYFDDAEKDPLPSVYFPVLWKDVSSYFEQEVTKIAPEILHLFS